MEKLYIVSGKYQQQSFEIKDETTYIGRSPDNDIQIRDNYVSRTHLKLRRKGDQYFIKDLNSTNGTFVNGKRIGSKSARRLEEGDIIVTGMTLICLGERSSQGVLAFLDSIEPVQEYGDTNKFLRKDRTLSS